MTEEELENILENVTEKLKKVFQRKAEIYNSGKTSEPLNNVEYDLSEAEKKLLSKGPSF